MNMDLKIQVPTSLSEINLRRYQQFIAIQENSNDEEFIAQKMVETFCGIELKDVVKIKLTSLNDLIVHFTNLFAQKPEFQTRFKIGDMEFGFIPELQEITFGEYVDLESHLKSWSTFHKAMAVLYRPITKKQGNKYDIAEYNANQDMQDLMKFTPLDVCIAASLFFWSLGSELIKATVNYLQTEIAKDKTLLTTLTKELNLPNNGDGIKAYMHSLGETLEDLTRLQNLDLLNVLPISRSKNKKTKSNKESLTEN